MSSFAHINQSPVLNTVLGTTVPARWHQLIQENFATIKDSSLSGIHRTIYASPLAETAAQGRPSYPCGVTGEIWKAVQEEGVASPAQTFKVSGYVQMYVVSGTGEIIKNGQTIHLRPGEKVSFKATDTFSLAQNSALTLFVRNEHATFEVATSVPTLSALRPPSEEQIALTRAMLGISPQCVEPRVPGREVLSSRGYARSRAG
jgi:hypothetical protein